MDLKIRHLAQTQETVGDLQTQLKGHTEQHRDLSQTNCVVIKKLHARSVELDQAEAELKSAQTHMKNAELTVSSIICGL